MVPVEFECAKCGRLVYDWFPEDTDFNKLDTTFEHDFDCSELDELEEE